MTGSVQSHQQPLVPSVRPEFERDVLDAGVIGDISRPLSLWERLTGNALARRIFILVLLGAAWQIYAVWSDNPLMFPTLSETLTTLW
ncbi:MAG TPA: ABC transporter permease, partial [Skermanella sp.]|nr:ABC transporter permease [Skermanella sp.]